jgi:hypothetical protein
MGIPAIAGPVKPVFTGHLAAKVRFHIAVEQLRSRRQPVMKRP